jgi:hypothetical protein
VAKKYYGLAGKNGYGVYHDYDKLTEARIYIRASRIKGFDSFEEAKEWVEDQFWEMQPMFVSTSIENIKSLNWTYFAKSNHDISY